MTSYTKTHTFLSCEVSDDLILTYGLHHGNLQLIQKKVNFQATGNNISEFTESFRKFYEECKIVISKIQMYDYMLFENDFDLFHAEDSTFIYRDYIRFQILENGVFLSFQSTMINKYHSSSLTNSRTVSVTHVENYDQLLNDFEFILEKFEILEVKKSKSEILEKSRVNAPLKAKQESRPSLSTYNGIRSKFFVDDSDSESEHLYAKISDISLSRGKYDNNGNGDNGNNEKYGNNDNEDNGDNGDNGNNSKSTLRRQGVEFITPNKEISVLKLFRNDNSPPEFDEDDKLFEPPFSPPFAPRKEKFTPLVRETNSVRKTLFPNEFPNFNKTRVEQAIKRGVRFPQETQVLQITAAKTPKQEGYQQMTPKAPLKTINEKKRDLSSISTTLFFDEDDTQPDEDPSVGMASTPNTNNSYTLNTNITPRQDNVQLITDDRRTYAPSRTYKPHQTSDLSSLKNRLFM